MSSDEYHKSQRWGYVIFGATTIIVSVVISASIFLTVRDSNRSTEQQIDSCTSNGGSWIVDGNKGECWQKDMLFKDGGL